MSYNIEKAIKKFQWRFRKNEKGEFISFKPTYDDVLAINSLLTWINNQKKKTIENNQILAKLLIYQYIQNIRFYETTVVTDFNFAQKDLSKVLSKPLESFYQSFYRDIHDNQLNKLVKYKNINNEIDEKIERIEKGDLIVDDFLLNKYKGLDNYIIHLQKSKITKKKAEEVVKEYQNLKETFTFDYVKSKLNDMITEAYNRFN
jgi:hypothetical protein